MLRQQAAGGWIQTVKMELYACNKSFYGGWLQFAKFKAVDHKGTNDGSIDRQNTYGEVSQDVKKDHAESYIFNVELAKLDRI